MPLKVAVFALLADSSNENPYEDIELESQCSQQSLPSSPGADSAKVSGEDFYYAHVTLLPSLVVKSPSILLSPGFKARFLQTELRQELQAAGPAQDPPVRPQSQRRWRFIPIPQSPLHAGWIRALLLAARRHLHPHVPTDTDGVPPRSIFQLAVYLFSHSATRCLIAMFKGCYHGVMSGHTQLVL